MLREVKIDQAAIDSLDLRFSRWRANDARDHQYVGNDDKDDDVPHRIIYFCRVALKDSTLYGGKGIFANRAFSGGDLVFSIEQPLFAIVS